MPFVVAVSGFKDSGKTTLCMELVERLKERGVDVAFIKHSCESPLSGASTDSGRGLLRGVPTLLWSDEGVRLERAGALSLEEVVYHFFPAVDVVIVEGAKALPLPRIWVAPGGDVPEAVPGVIARYDRTRTENRPEERLFGSEGGEALASLLFDMWRRAEPTDVALYGGTRRIPAKAFVADFLAGGVKGMVRALKGGEDLAQGLSLFISRERTGDGGS